MQGYIQKKVLISVLLLTGITFCQEIKVCIKKNGCIHVINTLDIEEYVMGVLSKEMDSGWHEEALKAQAVVSRTFALYMASESRKKNLPYDIENSIFHQVYDKTDCKTLEKAVKETKGEILTYNGKIVPVFFHSNCGGRTAKSSDVWGGYYEHITSVEDPYCINTPYSFWERSFSQKDLSRIFGVSSLEEITIEDKDASGRIISLRLKGKDDKIIRLTGHRFRMMVNEGENVTFNNPDIIPSTNFNVRKEGMSFIFTGKGYGHGVGMCQWGAKKMAEKGFGYREILKHFFPNMEISHIN